MKTVSADQIKSAISYRDMVEALRRGFQSDITVPLRHHHTIAKQDGEDSVLLLMPAWETLEARPSANSFAGVKIATVTPDNALRNKASVQAIYLLNDGESGEPLALIDGQMLTFYRTACASALAADYLARDDAKSLLMVGSGGLAEHVIEAHCSVRDYERISIWNRNGEKASALASAIGRAPSMQGRTIEPATDLEAAARSADTIACATLSKAPLILGEWLQPGQHVDLIGAFTPQMRETDTACLHKATVFLDTEGALVEAGDLAAPVASGDFDPDMIAADLFDLCRKKHAGRSSADEITLFKSAGTAIEDLAGAILIHEAVS